MCSRGADLVLKLCSLRFFDGYVKRDRDIGFGVMDKWRCWIVYLRIDMVSSLIWSVKYLFSLACTFV